MFNNPYMPNPYGFNQYNTSQNMNTLQQPQMQTSTQQLIRVNGIEGARAYQMAPNSVVALFDSNEDLMYIKASDGAGFSTVRVFKFSALETEPKTESKDFISRSEFEQFKQEVFNYGKQFIHEQQSSNANTASNKSADDK